MGFFKGTEKMVVVADNYFVAPSGPADNLYRVIRDSTLYIYAFLIKWENFRIL